MPDAGGGDKNKVTIEFEVLSKKAMGEIDKLEAKLDDVQERRGKGRKQATKAGKEEVAAAKTLTHAHQGLIATYDKAAKSSSRLEKSWGSIRKSVQYLAKDAKQGFLAGLARGTGLAGMYRSVRGQPGGPGFRQRLGGSIGRGAVGLGSMGVGWAMGGLQNAYQTAMQFGQAQWGMTGMGAGRADIRRGKRAFGAGIKYGFTPTETAGMAPSVAAATGAFGATTTAQRFAVAGGYGPGRVGEAIQHMGTMRQAGQQFGVGGRDQKTLAKTIAAGMFSGLEKARLPEFYEGVRGLVQAQFGTAAGKVDAVSIAKQMAVLGKYGGVGFQGQRGGQIMGQLDQMIKAPGAGEAGQAMILQAMGFGKPGGKTSYYEALKMQQKGIQDPENIKRVMKEVYSQRGSVAAGGADPKQREANMQFSELSGLSLEQTEKLKDIYLSNKDQATKDAKIAKVLDDSKDLQTQAMEATKDGFAGIKIFTAGLEAQQIRAGSKVMEPMMWLQNLQMDVLNKVADYVPDLVNWLKKIWEMLKEIGMFIREMSMDKLLGRDDEDKLKRMRSKFYEEADSLIGRKAEFKSIRGVLQHYQTLGTAAAQLEGAAVTEAEKSPERRRRRIGPRGEYVEYDRPDTEAERTRSIASGWKGQAKDKADLTSLAVQSIQKGGAFKYADKSQEAANLLAGAVGRGDFREVNAAAQSIILNANMSKLAAATKESTEATKDAIAANKAHQTYRGGGNAKKRRKPSGAPPGATE